MIPVVELRAPKRDNLVEIIVSRTNMSKGMRWVIGVGTVAVLAYFGASTEEYWDAIRRLSWVALLAAYLVVSINRVVMAWKWNLLLGVVTQPLRLARAIQIYCTSQLYGLALPATVGGDSVRVVLTVKEGRPATATAASLVVERVLGVVVTTGVGVIAMLVAGFHAGGEPAHVLGLTVVAGLFVLSALATAASMNQSLYRLLHERVLGRFSGLRPAAVFRRFHEAYMAFRGEGRVLSLYSAWTVVEVGLYALLMHVLLLSLGSRVDFETVLTALVVASLLGRLPISIAGLGVFEAGFVYLMSLEGVPSEVALLASILSRVVQIAVWLTWWAMYMTNAPEPPPLPADGPPARRQ